MTSRSPYLLRRDSGEEQPHWHLGPFKVRLPLVHYPLEWVETLQALVLFVVGLSMIPLLEQHLGLPYEVALAYVVVCGALYLVPILLGVPFAPGWITPAIPLVVLFLSDFDPGPEAIRALVALQLLVAAIFFILGITKLGGKLVRGIPSSLKGGILIGAGIAAIYGEISAGGNLAQTPISIVVGGLVCVYVLFSVSLNALRTRSRIASTLANYGLVPGLVVAIGVGWTIGEYPLPQVEWGITRPAFSEMWEFLPFSVGFPGWQLFMAAIPTAIIAYVIAYGDIIVGTAVVEKASEDRKDEAVDLNADRVHLVTGVRNLAHSFFAPIPGLAGPIWTAVTTTVATRYTFGRRAMESIYSGTGTFYAVGFGALFVLPLVSLFQPVLPIALSLTLLITGYVCLSVGIQQLQNPTQQGIAGVTGVVLAVYGAAWGLAVGVVLYLLVERTSLFSRATKHDEKPHENV